MKNVCWHDWGSSQDGSLKAAPVHAGLVKCAQRMTFPNGRRVTFQRVSFCRVAEWTSVPKHTSPPAGASAHPRTGCDVPALTESASVVCDAAEVGEDVQICVCIHRHLG